MMLLYVFKLRLKRHIAEQITIARDSAKNQERKYLKKMYRIFQVNRVIIKQKNMI